MRAVSAARGELTQEEATALAREAAQALLRLEEVSGDEAALGAVEELAASDVPAALAVSRLAADAAPDDDWRWLALARAAALAQRCDDRGPDAAAVLEAQAALALAKGDVEADPVAERALAALARAGENARAGALLARAAQASSGRRRAAWLERLAQAARARGDLAAARAAREEALVGRPGRRRPARGAPRRAVRER